MTELLPDRATYDPSTPIVVEVRDAPASGELTVWHLGEEVLRRPYDGSARVELEPLPSGGYGLELASGEQLVRTAVDVGAADRSRMRYGFATDYSPDRSAAGPADTARRLHLTDILFYDWAYRHADLLGGGDDYRDALDQPISLATVKRLVNAFQAVGARALGYAAVYAVGPSDWEPWKHAALLAPDGEPYGLGDFLFVLDPASPDWLVHFTDDLRRAVSAVGFDGFHLDQYGYPKQAVRPDGTVVDVAESFVSMLESVRAALPTQRLVFNNVNDFPTWRTATSPQDAVYIEVWAPTVTLGALADVVSRARSLAGELPVVIAAYQHVYDFAPASQADLATSFTMATLFSHGATHLLAGEADRLLVDPYYVRNHVVEPSTADLLRRWYDFLVEHGDLLVEPGIVDVTAAVAGPYNEDSDVSYSAAEVSETATPGAVWRRITRAGNRTIVHLINLCGQENALWDSPRLPPANPGESTLRVRRTGNYVPRVRVADPDGIPRVVDVPVETHGAFATAQLPPLSVWQVIVIDLVGGPE